MITAARGSIEGASGYKELDACEMRTYSAYCHQCGFLISILPFDNERRDYLDNDGIRRMRLCKRSKLFG
jgi:hypothetical protein